MAITGLLSFKSGPRWLTLHFIDQGWLAADMVQYLDEVLEAVDRDARILKLLGFTMAITAREPRRKADHWVLVDVEKRLLETNSDLIRRAIDRNPPEPDSPWSELAMKRIHAVLDRYDFTVKLYR